MSNKNIADLREHLFATLDALRDRDNPMDVERAKAVSEVAKQIIDSAKVEVDYLRVAGGGEAPFLDAIGKDNLPPGLPPGAPPVPPANGIVGMTRHLIR